MKKRLSATILGVLLLAVFSLTSANAQTSSSVVKFKIKVRNNTSVEIGATVIKKSGRSRGETILVLNGTSQTAKTFTALAQSLIASNAGVSKMILLDYPGHGNSGLPFGSSVKFGDLTMDDYVTVLINSLDKLEDFDLEPSALMGHSLGAEIIQMAQTRLVRSGKSLKREFGIKGAIFIVPDIANPLPWAAIDAGAADGLAALYVRPDAVRGSVFDLTLLAVPTGFPTGPQTWVGLFYGNNAGVPVAGSPTPDQALASGFISLESAAMVKQLIGLPDMPGGPRKPRPFIDANTFTRSRGTTAGVITLEQDGILYAFPTEHRNVYRFVTGDQTDRLFFAFTGPLTVHNVHTITPGIFNGAIKQILDSCDDDDDHDDDDD